MEYLVLRTTNSVRAALRLIRGGFYDEALNLLRSAGEVVNLLNLFERDADLLRRWQTMDPRQRWNLLSPGKVRRMLEELDQPTLLDKDHYEKLSQIAHSTQVATPQAHNPLDVPMAGGHFQHGGFLVTLAEAATVAAVLILPATNLIPMPRDRWVLLHDAARRLVENTDFVGLDQAHEAYAQARSRLDARDA